MKLNLSRLESIAIILEDIKRMEYLITVYSEGEPGSTALLVAKPLNHPGVDLKIDRKLIVETLKAQIMSHAKDLEERFHGFEYDPEAKWNGDQK